MILHKKARLRVWLVGFEGEYDEERFVFSVNGEFVGSGPVGDV